MNSIQLLNIIKIQLGELKDLTNEFLSENKQPVALDKELLKKQCIALYDSISKLPVAIIETVEENPGTGSEDSSTVVEEFEIKETNIIIKNEEETPVQLPDEITREEVLADEKISITPESKPAHNLFNETSKEKSNLINIHSYELSLHEKISGSKHTGINERLSDPKVESLKAAIGLNKKIAFVNDLFKENTVDYAKAIDKLNSSVDLNEALRYFNELKHQYSWNNEHDLVIELEQLIQKRFK